MVVHCCIVKLTSFQRDGRQCYEYLFASVKRNKMDSELLFKFIDYFPNYLSALSCTLFTLVLDNLCRNSCIVSLADAAFNWSCNLSLGRKDCMTSQKSTCEGGYHMYIVVCCDSSPLHHFVSVLSRTPHTQK